MSNQPTSLLELKKSLQKTFKDTVFLTKDEAYYKSRILKTPSIILNYKLGIGGFPTGRVVEFGGWQGTGKSTIAIQTMALNPGNYLYMDYERTATGQYLDKYGVPGSDVIVIRPPTLEEGGNIAKKAVESGIIDAVIWDSVPAMIPQITEEKDEGGSSQHGTGARVFGIHLKKMLNVYERNETCGFYINQIREKIGVMFGSPEYLPGGNSMKFYATQRFKVSAVGRNQYEKDWGVQGHMIKVDIIKNKLGTPGAEKYNIPFRQGVGIDIPVETYILACELKLFTGGNVLHYNDIKLGNGKKNHVQFLRDNPELVNEIREEIVSIMEASREHDSED